MSEKDFDKGYKSGFKFGKEVVNEEWLVKIKKATNEICKINPVATTIGNIIPVMKSCDDIKLEVVAILNKLIAESEEVNETL